MLKILTKTAGIILSSITSVSACKVFGLIDSGETE